jgi:hypothetical protein
VAGVQHGESFLALAKRQKRALGSLEDNIADESGVRLATIMQIEPGKRLLDTMVHMADKLRRALEKGDVQFIPEDGVGHSGDSRPLHRSPLRGVPLG